MLSDWIESKLKEKWKIIFVIVPIGVIISLLFFMLYRRPQMQPVEEWEEMLEQTVDESLEETQTNKKETNIIFIDIKGAVKYPGVYESEEGMRVIDAIQLAGGITPEGDENQLNLALKLTDQMVVYVPQKGEIEGEQPQWSVSGSTASDEKININTANAEELLQLEGIGQKKAEGIIQYREENGSFQTIEDIKNVSGIGEKTFEKFKEKIDTGI